MTTMDQIHRIRELYYEQDKNLNEIAIIMNCDWRTVRKYVDMEDFNSPPPAPVSSEIHESKLDPFKPLIDEWLQADKLAPRKQRHTAKRVFKRLKDEADGFNCSYRLVALYVKFHEEAELDPSLDDTARRYFKLIEDGDKEANELFNLFKQIKKKK